MKRSLKKLTTVLAIAAMFLVTGSASPHATGAIVQTGMITTQIVSPSVWVKQQEVWYYQDSYGQIQTGWVNENGVWYYLNSSGAMQTGWLNENGNWYYLNENGAMQTGWLNENGNWYYLNENGAMQAGWLNENGNWYYLNENGAMQAGWLNENRNWYYLNSNGTMQTGWLNENGNWYYLSLDGSMVTGWMCQNGDWYYLYDDGSMAVDTWIDFEYIDRNGIWIEQLIPNIEQLIPNIEQLIPNIEQLIPNQEQQTTDQEQQTTDQEQQTTDQEQNQFTSDNTEIPTEETTEETSNATEDNATEDVTLRYIKEQLEILEEKYPDGMYWNHMGYTARQNSTNYYSETVTSIPCNHAFYGTSYCNSYINYSLAYIIGVQCDGFARKLSDEIFGENTGKTDYSYNFDAIKVGDYIRYNDSHTVLVIEKDETGIQVAECNIGGTCMIRWGRRITRSELDNYRSVTCFTRY